MIVPRGFRVPLDATEFESEPALARRKPSGRRALHKAQSAMAIATGGFVRSSAGSNLGRVRVEMSARTVPQGVDMPHHRAALPNLCKFYDSSRTKYKGLPLRARGSNNSLDRSAAQKFSPGDRTFEKVLCIIKNELRARPEILSDRRLREKTMGHDTCRMLDIRSRTEGGAYRSDRNADRGEVLSLCKGFRDYHSLFPGWAFYFLLSHLERIPKLVCNGLLFANVNKPNLSPAR